MLDYVLTVSVSVAAGVDAITSAIPRLAPWVVPLGLLAIGVLLAGNLRGVRAAGKIFAAPTYAFIAGIAVLLAVGLVPVRDATSTSSTSPARSACPAMPARQM